MLLNEDEMKANGSNSGGTMEGGGSGAGHIRCLGVVPVEIEDLPLVHFGTTLFIPSTLREHSDEILR